MVATLEAIAGGMPLFYGKGALRLISFSDSGSKKGLPLSQVRAIDGARKFEQLKKGGAIPQSWALTGSALVSVYAVDDIKIFFEVNMGGRGRHYIGIGSPVEHLRLMTQGADGALQPNRVTSITVLSGPCLFSVGGANAVMEDGRRLPLTDPHSQPSGRIVGVEATPAFTYYEEESVARVTAAIREYARSMPVRRFAINLPRIEYYLYALDIYNSGAMPSDVALRWFEMVDGRADRIAEMQRGSVGKNALGAQVEVGSASPLEPVGAMVRERVRRGEQIPLQLVLDALERSNDAWRMAFGVIRNQEGDALRIPQSFEELNYLSYAVAELTATPFGDRNALTVAIENPEEFQILELAKSIAGESMKQGLRLGANVMGLYPFPQTLDAAQHSEAGVDARPYYSLFAPDEEARNRIRATYQPDDGFKGVQRD